MTKDRVRCGIATYGVEGRGPCGRTATAGWQLFMLVAVAASALGCGGTSGGAEHASELPVSAVPGLDASQTQQAIEQLAARVIALEAAADALEGEHAGLLASHTALQAEHQSVEARVEALEAALLALPTEVVVEYGSETGLSLQQALDASYQAEQGLNEALTQAEAVDQSLVDSQQELAADVVELQAAIAESKDEIQSVQNQMGKPSACPDDMVAINGRTCIEKEARSETFFIIAMRRCEEDSRYLCGLTDICGATYHQTNQDITLAEPTPDQSPHWVGDSAGRLPVQPSGDYYISGLAVQGDGFECEYAEEAGVLAKGEGTASTTYPYRCCLPR